jgi:hypothetical protein
MVQIMHHIQDTLDELVRDVHAQRTTTHVLEVAVSAIERQLNAAVAPTEQPLNPFKRLAETVNAIRSGSAPVQS